MEGVHQRRRRLMALSVGILVGLGLLLFSFPMPFWTTTQGVVWLPEDALVRAGTDCEVVEVLAPGNTVVTKGAPLLRGSDPLLETQRALYQAQLRELQVRFNALPLRERVKRRIMLEEIERTNADLHQTEEKIAKLLVCSPSHGQLVLIDERHLEGRFLREGDLIGYIIADHRPTVRAVVKQEDIGLIRGQLTGVEIRLSEHAVTALAAEVTRIVPAADHQLPSAALGTAGGGAIPVDPTDVQGLRALKSYFQLDLGLPEAIAAPHIGGRAYVRFDHGRLPLALQWYRSLRQLFLRKFYV
jgi:putative peptide zinc metalloprotease protein